MASDNFSTQPADPRPPVDQETGLPVREAADMREVLRQQRAELEQAGRSGANWLYWVAALSLVNSAIMHFGGNIQFVVGLAVTLIVDAVAKAIGTQEPDIAAAATAVAIMFDLFVAGLVAGSGWLANKRYLVVFGIAMVLYLLDGLICLLFGDLFSAGFHAFALFGMWNGFQAYRKLASFEVAEESLRTYGAEFR